MGGGLGGGPPVYTLEKIHYRNKNENQKHTQKKINNTTGVAREFLIFIYSACTLIIMNCPVSNIFGKAVSSSDEAR